jgi:phage terminase large subunit
MSDQRIDFPDKLAPLFDYGYRYYVLRGGRGGAKSWGIARALLVQAAERPLRIGCFREIQKSIQESVHHLLADQIKSMGLSHFYEVQNTQIIGKNGSHFVFAGLRSINVEQIKSYEGLDVAWVEEARNVSKKSWDTLIPTIRQDGSRILLSFNPELDTDETYVRFVTTPPPSCIDIEMNWRDNPWFPKVLVSEKDAMLARDPDGYLTVWEGKTRVALEGAIYAKELRESLKAGRVCKVPIEPTLPVDTFWDIGRADGCAIWFTQMVGMEPRVIDYHEARNEDLPYYLKMMQSKPYLWGNDYLPHDGHQKRLGSPATVIQQIKSAGRTVLDVPEVSVFDGIMAARTMFARLLWDEDRTKQGRNRLARYRYEVDENGLRSEKPLHDGESHAADALRYMAVVLTGITRRPRKGAIVAKKLQVA